MAGLEIVYTVHKFEAENVDEISINVGEQVIVLEKDEGFNDGWWQGRNVRGEIGLFPITYTVKQPPTTLENKIDSLENAISRMKVPSTKTNSTTSKHIQSNVNQSLLQNTKPVEEWTSEQVATWLIDVGFDQELADNFRDQEISGDILLELTLDSLKELQVTTFGKRFKIHSAINVLRQESKKQKYASSSIEARVASPFPDLNNSNTSRNNSAAISSYYNSNKQQQPYVDDDLVSDYSTVIRNSRLQVASPKVQEQKIVAPRPSIPLDMDLIASSPRLSTLVERQGSVSSTITNSDRQTQQQRQQQQQHQQARLLQQQQLQLQQQQREQQREQQRQQQQRIQQLQQQREQQRPVSHQNPPPTSLINGSSEWKRNTINNIKSQETEEVPRSSTSSRYSFMRNSLLPNNNKLQSIFPNAVIVRRSEDVSDISAIPDMEGWLYKQGDKYKTWNKRWFVLKTNNLFYFKSPKAVRMKGIINLKGYRIEVDESIQPGKYCFKAHHERERTFYFYTDFEKSMKDWLKALMKATIARDFATPVMSSSTIPTVSLEMARKMRPRPPSTIFHQKEPSRSPTPSNYRIHNNLDHHFSLMALDENNIQPIMSFSHQQDRSRARSSMSLRQQAPQQRVMSPDNASEYSTRLKDSGFNSAHGANLTRSITESSSNSSTRKSNSAASVQIQNTSSIATSPASAIFYPDEEDEDLIDPEHMSVIESNRPEKEMLYRHQGEQEEEELDHYTTTVLKKQRRYMDWINSNVQKANKINNIADLCTGEALLELLESLSHKEIMRPIMNSSQSVNVQRMDRIIAAFKFMSLEGVELDGACTVRDILNGNVDKTMYMLDAIKYWCKTNSGEVVNGKKMASGGTFGEDDQCKLRELEETENILPPNTFASR